MTCYLRAGGTIWPLLASCYFWFLGCSSFEGQSLEIHKINKNQILQTQDSKSWFLEFSIVFSVHLPTWTIFKSFSVFFLSALLICGLWRFSPTCIPSKPWGVVERFERFSTLWSMITLVSICSARMLGSLRQQWQQNQGLFNGTHMGGGSNMMLESMVILRICP